MGSGEVAGAGCTHHHTVVHVTWSSRRPDRSHHETPPHFPPALPPPDPGLRGPAKAQQEQQENRGQLRAGRQQQPRGRNNRNNTRNNNTRNNNNRNNNGRRAKAGKCGGGAAPNHSYKGQNFLISWRLGCSKFTQSQAERFCKSNNMRAVSLDSRDREDHFLGLVAKDRQRYFWTGGQVRNGRISWPSGRRYNDVAWSHTGGVKLPQPDNREGDEVCLAVLNNSTLTASGSTTCPVITRNLSSVKPSQDKSGIVK